MHVMETLTVPLKLSAPNSTFAKNSPRQILTPDTITAIQPVD